MALRATGTQSGASRKFAPAQTPALVRLVRRIYRGNPIYTYTEGISSSALVIIKIYFLQ